MKKILLGFALILTTLHVPHIYSMEQRPSLLSRCLQTYYDDRILFGAGGLALYAFDSQTTKAIATACVLTLYTCAKYVAAPIQEVPIPEEVTPARIERQKIFRVLGLEFTVTLR